MTRQLRLRLLGTFVAELDGEQVQDFGYDKVRALIAYLALQPRVTQRRDTLAGLLWPEDDDRRARHSLSQALLQLRRAIGDRGDGEPFILADRNSIQLNAEASLEVDVNEFLTHLDQGSVHDHGEEELCADCAGEREAAVALYRGDFLEGLAVPDSVAFEEWVTVTRERLQRRAIEALYALTFYHEARGEWAEARRYGERQVALEPWREEGHRQLMRLMARQGQYNAALAQFESCREVLASELGVKPMPQTAALYRRIREIRKQGGRRPVPTPPTPFIGRRKEMARLGQMILDSQRRLVSVVGPPGIGKSRLALATAEAHTHAFLEGVAFVPLAPVNSLQGIVFAIANVLNLALQGAEAPKTQLLAGLSQREQLLVLDSFEHLIDHVTLVDEIMEQAPRVTMLVTSRRRLALPAEWVLELQGLDVPAGEIATSGDARAHSGIKLFLERARQAAPDIDLQEEEKAIVEICRLVEGMPLAIELAAAQVRYRRPSLLRSELEHTLEVLDASIRTAEERHGSMNAVLRSAWQRLAHSEQQALARLAVFRGGCTREAALQITGAADADLAALIDKSLVRRTAGGRLELHALILLFARERLADVAGEEAQTYARHRDYYLDLLATAVDRWQQSHDIREFDSVGADLDNVLACWRRLLLSRRWDDIAVCVDALWQFYKLQRRLPEAIALLGQVIDLSGSDQTGPGAYRARWNRLMGEAHLWLSRLEQGEDYFLRTLKQLDLSVPASGAPLMLGIAGLLAGRAVRSVLPLSSGTPSPEAQGALREAVLAYERLAERAAVENETARGVYCGFQALRLAERSGKASLMARAYAYAGYMYAVIPWRALAESYLEKADNLAEVESSLAVRGRVSWFYSLYLAGIGRWREAETHARRFADAAGKLGEHWNKEIGWVILLTVAYGRGSFSEGLAWARKIRDSAQAREDAGFFAAALYWEAILRLRKETTLKEVLYLLDEAASAPPEVMNRFDWILVHAARGEVYLRLGNFEQARREVDRAAALIADVARPAHCATFPGYAMTANVYLSLWERTEDAAQKPALLEATKQACRSLEDFARIFPMARARALIYLGRYEWIKGNPRKARRLWQKALQQASSMAMPFEEALAHYELGRHPHAPSDRGKVSDSDLHLARASQTFEALGAQHEVERARRATEKLH